MLQRPVYAYDSATHYFVMAVSAQKVQIWKLDQLADTADSEDGVEPLGELETTGGALKGMTLCADGGLVTVHETGLVVSWDLESVIGGEPAVNWKCDTGLLVSELAAHREAVSQRHLMALGGEGGRVAMLELVKGDSPRLVHLPEAHSDKVEVLVFSEDDERLATSARDRKIAIWSTEIREESTEEGKKLSLERLRLLTGSGGWPLSLAFSADHKKLVTGCMDNGVYLWDLEGDDALESVRFDHHGWVEDVAWTNDDKTILTGSWDNAAGVYSIDPLMPQFHFKYHSDYVVRVLPVPATNLLFAASYDGDVTVWDHQKGRLIAVLEGHGDWVTELEWLGDDRVVSLSSDRTARIWSTTDFSLQAVLGESLVQGFELQGGFDLASFGIGAQEEQVSSDAERNLEDLQSQVVRRFDSSDPLADEGSQKTAMAMLEDAVDRAETVDATTVGDDVSEESDRFVETSEPEPELDKRAEFGGGVGDELSDMVWEAISDVEDLGTGEGKLDLPGPDDLQERLEEDIDVSLSSSESDTSDLGAVKSDSEEDDGADQALDLLDVPDIETASVADLGDFSSSDDDDGDDVAAAWAAGEMESPEDVELNLDASEDKDFPSIEEISKQAFQEAKSEVDIMDSAFDPASFSTEDREKDEEQEERKEQVASSAEAPEKGIPKPSSHSRDPAPTSGPLYDPKPLGPDDDVGEFLPDDDELDLAFSGSISEVSEVSDSRLGQPFEDSDQERPSQKVDSKERDVDRSDGEDEEEAERDPPGKADPSFAMGAQSKADGGEEGQWKRGRAQSTLTGAKPMATSDYAAVEPSPREIKTQKVDAQSVAREDHERIEAARKEKAKHRHDPITGERRQTQKLEETKKVTRIGAPAVSALKPEPEVDQNWGNSTQMWTGRTEARQEEQESESEVDQDWGNSTQMWTGTSEADSAHVESTPKSPVARGLSDFKRREKTLGGRQAGSSLAARLKAKKKGLKSRLSQSLKVDPSPPKLSFSAAESSVSDVDDDQDEEPSAPPSTESSSTESSGKRLTPGADATSDQLKIPEPEVSEVVEAPSDTNTSRLVTVSLDELWSQASSSAPPMGILKRSLDPETEYQPMLQFRTEHQGAIGLAVSPNEKRLVTVGSQGYAEIWNVRGQRLARVQISDGELVDVGFVDENFFWALDSNGMIHLWLLPKAVLGKATNILHTTIPGGGTPFQCGWLVAKKNLLLTGGDDGQARLWSLHKGHCVARLADHGSPVTAVTLGQKGPITASADGQVRFWNSRGLQVDQVDISGRVTGLMASDGLVIWVEDTGALSMMREGDNHPTRLKGHHGQGRGLYFRSDGYFISGGEDGRMLLYDGEATEPAQEIQIPAPIHSLIMVDRVLAAACEGGAVFVFKRKSSKKS